MGIIENVLFLSFHSQHSGRRQAQALSRNNVTTTISFAYFSLVKWNRLSSSRKTWKELVSLPSNSLYGFRSARSDEHNVCEDNFVLCVLNSFLVSLEMSHLRAEASSAEPIFYLSIEEASCERIPEERARAGQKNFRKRKFDGLAESRGDFLQ